MLFWFTTKSCIPKYQYTTLYGCNTDFNLLKVHTSFFTIRRRASRTSTVITSCVTVAILQHSEERKGSNILTDDLDSIPAADWHRKKPWLLSTARGCMIAWDFSIKQWTKPYKSPPKPGKKFSFLSSCYLKTEKIRFILRFCMEKMTF